MNTSGPDLLIKFHVPNNSVYRFAVPSCVFANLRKAIDQ